MISPSSHNSLRDAAIVVMLDEAAIKVPREFVELARKVGSNPTFAERTYRDWIKRGLSPDRIKDKIIAHGKKVTDEKKKNESLDEALNTQTAAFIKFLDDNSGSKNLLKKVFNDLQESAAKISDERANDNDSYSHAWGIVSAAMKKAADSFK